MYQGKFQRSDDALPVTPAQEHRETAAPAEEALPVKPSAPRRTKKDTKKGLSKSTLIFIAALLTYVLVAFIGIAIGMSFLDAWLVNFEAAQPQNKSQQVFNQLFSNPDWSKLYTEAGQQDTAFEDGNTYAAYMNKLVGTQGLKFVETSAGLSGDHKYIVKAGETQIAVFTLTADNKDAQVPDWKLGSMELLIQRNEYCTILTAPGNAVTVNGVQLDDSYIVKNIATKAEDHLPTGIHGYQAVVYRVDQLLTAPTVKVIGADGQAVSLQYDEVSRSFIHSYGTDPITNNEKDTVVTAAQMYCKYMIGQASSATLKNYFDSTSDVYYTMTHIDKWMQSYKGYKFEDAVVTDFYRYTDNLYSARVDMSLLVTRKDNTVKDYPLHSTFIMEKQGSSWKVIDMLNLNIQEQTVSVKLTFMNEDQLIKTEWVSADVKALTLPTVTAPAGMQHSGWYINSIDANGNPSRDLVFEPDAQGNVTLSGEKPLEAMTLFAYFTPKEA